MESHFDLQLGIYETQVSANTATSERSRLFSSFPPPFQNAEFLPILQPQRGLGSFPVSPLPFKMPGGGVWEGGVWCLVKVMIVFFNVHTSTLSLKIRYFRSFFAQFEGTPALSKLIIICYLH